MKAINPEEIFLISGGVSQEVIDYVDANPWAKGAVWGGAIGGVISLVGILGAIVFSRATINGDPGVACCALLSACPGIVIGGSIGAVIGGFVQLAQNNS